MEFGQLVVGNTLFGQVKWKLINFYQMGRYFILVDLMTWKGFTWLRYKEIWRRKST